ncbi:MAG: TerB family tellurite resistance protein [Rhodoferax sp.]|nr:TerB family tellurite resistance protein [Rhodoferax sp.]
MRSYPRNSPEDAARIVALVLIADGHVCRSEIDALTQLDAPRELGLDPDGLPRILQTLCEDLLMGDIGGGSMLGGVDDSTLASPMAEVDEPELQRKVLRLAVAAALGDRHLADGEKLVLEAARRHWGISGEADEGSRFATADAQAA